MKKIAMITLGCRVNQYETQAVREALLEKGFLEGSFDEPCRVYFVNTCAVTGESVRKSRQMIRRALRQKELNPEAVVCVCGCHLQGVGEDELFSAADIVTGNTNKNRLASAIETLVETPANQRKRMDLRSDIAKVKEFEPMSVCRSHNARAFVKIQDGCNSFCSYCYVPLVRGRVRSRDPEEILAEVRRLAENGYREIVLTGIETGSYGEDRREYGDLASLVEKIHEVCGVERIRFGSLKPSIFTDSFCAKLANLPKVMPHFHLSLQSGSSSVLEKMGRKYNREDEKRAVDAIYRHFPDAGLSADLICAFPGETDEDFKASLSLVEESGLLHTHIFPFSPREGTRAAKLKEEIAPEEKKMRCSVLLEKAKESSLRFAEKREGKRYRILVERIRDGFAFGYTENFIYTKIFADQEMKVGEIVPICLGSEKNFSVETMTVASKRAEMVDNSGKK